MDHANAIPERQRRKTLVYRTGNFNVVVVHGRWLDQACWTNGFGAANECGGIGMPSMNKDASIRIKIAVRMD